MSLSYTKILHERKITNYFDRVADVCLRCSRILKCRRYNAYPDELQCSRGDLQSRVIIFEYNQRIYRRPGQPYVSEGLDCVSLRWLDRGHLCSYGVKV